MINGDSDNSGVWYLIKFQVLFLGLQISYWCLAAWEWSSAIKKSFSRFIIHNASVRNLQPRSHFHLCSSALPHWLWPFPGQLQAETWNQQGACAFHLDLWLCPCDPARTDEQQWEVWEVHFLELNCSLILLPYFLTDDWLCLMCPCCQVQGVLWAGL